MIQTEDSTETVFKRLSKRMYQIAGLESTAELTKENFIQFCVKIAFDNPEEKTPKVFIPVDLPPNTKRNRDRLIVEDHNSPSGLIIKKDPIATQISSRAIAAFNVYELMSWASSVED